MSINEALYLIKKFRKTTELHSRQGTKDRHFRRLRLLLAHGLYLLREVRNTHNSRKVTFSQKTTQFHNKHNNHKFIPRWKSIDPKQEKIKNKQNNYLNLFRCSASPYSIRCSRLVTDVVSQAKHNKRLCAENLSTIWMVIIILTTKKKPN